MNQYNSFRYYSQSIKLQTNITSIVINNIYFLRIFALDVIFEHFKTS